MEDLAVGGCYKLIARSNGPFDTEAFDRVEYLGDMEFWWPNDREFSIVSPIPCFRTFAGNRLVGVRREDIVSVRPVD